jgi:serine/threonine-protein kinase
LTDGGIITALAGATVRRDTGLWLCELGGVRKEIYVKDGVPEFVTSNLAGELLGEYLVARGVISRGELDMALAVMPRFEGRLGDTLTALGLVEPVHLFQHIAGQVREKLLDLFLWTGGSAALYRGVPPPHSGFPLGLDPWAILNEGIRRRIAQGMEDERFAGRQMDKLTQVRPAPKDIVTQQLPADLRVLHTALETPLTLAEIGEILQDPRGRDKDKAMRSVILLLSLDAIKWASDG